MRNDADKKRSAFAIKSFHKGIFRYFRKHYTRSAFHPLNLIAAVGLSGRAALLLFLNSMKSDRDVD